MTLTTPQIPLPKAYPKILGEAPRVQDYAYNTNGSVDWWKTYQNWSLWNGYAILRYATKCEVTNELNGVYEAYVEVPLDHPNLNEAKVGRVLAIQCIPDTWDDFDLFRIYKIEFDESEMMRIYAQHLSYDLNGLIVPKVGTVYFTSNEMLQWAQLSTTTPLGYKNPFILRISEQLDNKLGALWGENLHFMDLLLGDKGLLEQTGGEVERYRNTVFMYSFGTIGGYNGINKEDELPFRVGQNVRNFQYSVDNSQAITHIMPYVVYSWEPPQTGSTNKSGSKDVYVNLRYVNNGALNNIATPGESISIVTGLTNDYNYVRTVPVDFSDLLSEEDYDPVKNVDSEDNVRKILAGKLFNRVNQIKNNLQYQMAYKPSISFDVDVQDIKNTPEFVEAFRDVKGFMTIKLGRRFNVHFPEHYNIAPQKMRITKTVFDSLSQEYLSFQAKTTFTNGIVLPKKFYG